MANNMVAILHLQSHLILKKKKKKKTLVVTLYSNFIDVPAEAHRAY